MDVIAQRETLESVPHSFQEYIKKETGSSTILPNNIGIFQINVGRLCNQTCFHCHVNAGPKRSEIMTRETMLLILQAIDATPEVHTVDLTGGAPEMNPHFHWFVQECTSRNLKVIDRCNLTILSEPGMEDMTAFLANNQVEVVASLPHFAANRTDQQRGKGVFEKSIEGLKKLNSFGYGNSDSKALYLVYNPSGLFLSPSQEQMEREYRIRLQEDFGIVFTGLYCINNMPINRFLKRLIHANKLQLYMDILVNAFNGATISGLMCRNQVSIDWEGFLYDCDFSQMLEYKANRISHIKDWNAKDFLSRKIVLANHCFGCTAGAGSSCAGSLKE